jgi:hypothetical protein
MSPSEPRKRVAHPVASGQVHRALGLSADAGANARSPKSYVHTYIHLEGGKCKNGSRKWEVGSLKSRLQGTGYR